MRRSLFLLIVAACLGLAPALADQKKPKDEFLYQYLVGQFEQVNTKLGQLDARVTSLDSALTQLKQQHSDMDSELRDAVNVTKATDTSLSSLRLNTQQELFEVKTDVAQARQDVAALADLVRHSMAQAPRTDSAPTAPAVPAVPEGYITVVDDQGVTINLGASASIKVGQQFGVFKVADPHTEVAVIEVTQILDEQNSRARIVFNSSKLTLEFSDIVRAK